MLEALSRIESAAKQATEAGADGHQLARKVVDVAVGVWDEDRERNVAIGDNGARWILEKLEREGTIEKGEKINVLTVSDVVLSSLATRADPCFRKGLQYRFARNLGSSPCVLSQLSLLLTYIPSRQAYGTALGVITSLHHMGRLSHAYYAQTGPYQQGARLTSMELASLGIENTMVCDTAIGALIAEKRVHLFVAGADR